MKQNILKALISACILSIAPCVSFAGVGLPTNVEEALRLAGSNRVSLEAVLEKYSQKKEDFEKWKAACFLIENMVWHTQGGRVIEYDHRIDSFLKEADSAYYTLVKGKSDSEIDNPDFNKDLSSIDWSFRKKVEATAFPEPQTEVEELRDICTLNGEFVVAQIEHAFALRKESPFVRALSFADFCSFVLPYRVITDYPLVESAKRFYDLYGKYLGVHAAANESQVVSRYNLAALRLRYFGGEYPFDDLIGFSEMFFIGKHDCVDIANYGAMALRACGLPVSVEYNTAYKLWAGRHFHVSTPMKGKVWATFRPESGLPTKRDPAFIESLNILRIYFERRPNNPYSLKATGEPVPDEFAGPCIEDVTSNYMDVVRVVLPFKNKTNNRLAYLASFKSNETGFAPVTWGVISKESITFANVVPGTLYFPFYYDAEGNIAPAVDPLWIERDSMQKCGYRLSVAATPQGKYVNTVLKRKFPRKPKMIAAAEKVCGTVVLGSDNDDFRKADILAVIREVPDTHRTDLQLQTKRAYRYYRVSAPKEYPKIMLSEIQFLADSERGYANTIEPSVSSYPADGAVKWVRLMDEPLENCKWKTEYDGNVQTAPEQWPDVTLRLKEPQVVDVLRYMVKHADNGIVPGDEYALMEWKNSMWSEVWTKTADNEFIGNNRLETGRLYWLRNLSKGKEEAPFVVNRDGEQVFVHEKTLRDLNQ